MMFSELILVSPEVAAQARAVLQFLEAQPPLPELRYKRRQLIHNGHKP